MVLDRWNDSAAPSSSQLLDQRVYSSRLLGADPELVMHGGGNTSVKTKCKNVFGEDEAVIYIKGSGWDLASIEAGGFSAVRLGHLVKLRELSALDDETMVNEFRTHLMDSRSPDPSVETLLHAYLPHPFVDHTHADAVLTLTNQPDAEPILRKIYGTTIGIVPYVMPGFALSKLCAEIYEKNPSVEGLILLKHGVLTFGQTAKESYQRMIRTVQAAESYLKEVTSKKKTISQPSRTLTPENKARWMQRIRKSLIKKGFPCVLTLDDSTEAIDFVNHPDVGGLSKRGPLTPDHVIRTKQFPAFIPEAKVSSALFDATEVVLETFISDYNAYFDRQLKQKNVKRQRIDAFPRVWLVPQVGIVTAGATARDAAIAKDIYHHTAQVILSAEQVGRYEALGEGDIFDMEYWILEQAKLKLGPKRKTLSGKVAVVTGGASGIGLAITRSLAESGADVFALDVNETSFKKLDEDLRPITKNGNRICFLKADVANRRQIQDSLTKVILMAGGIDFLIVNAGVFPASALIEEISDEAWQKSIDVNLTGSLHCVSESLKWMKEQDAGGDIIFIASKNATAPGPQAGAYSVAKAAQVQLARVCALESAKHGIRVNTLHPHLVFDTGLWTEEIIAKRAEAYQMTPQEYRRNNLLRTELSSRDVALATLALLEGAFSKTTGAQIPVDGGSDRTL